MRRERVSRLMRLREEFVSVYGEGEVRFCGAPARINIVGEHIDYVEYFRTAVLPFGSAERDMIMAFRPRPDGSVRARSLWRGYDPGRFSIDEFAPPPGGDPDERWEWFLREAGVPPSSWLNYIKASAFYLRNLHPETKLKGIDLLIDSRIPPAGGASSSSALVVVSGVGLRAANGMELDMDELADSSSKAEWFVGTRGGKMDHATMCFAREGHALLITFRPFSVEPVPMPVSGYRWVTLYTHPADKGSAVMSEYNERSVVSKFIIPQLIDSNLRPKVGGRWEEILKAIAYRDLRSLERLIGEAEEMLDLLPERMSLREFLSRFGELEGTIRQLYPALIRVKGMETPLKVRDRAKHHLGEIYRVLSAAELLRRAFEAELEGDKERELELMGRVGEILTESHRSLRDLYEVSTPELDEVVELALSCDGVLGARVMGGGFGGNALVLVEADRVGQLIREVEEGYYAPRRRPAPESIMISTPGGGVWYLSDQTARLRLIELANDPERWPEARVEAEELARRLTGGRPIRPVKPVIAAAGKGERARRSGLSLPKPLIPIRGKPVVRYVAEKFLKLPFEVERLIVIVSPEGRDMIAEALEGMDVEIVLQERPLGTGDAVLSAKGALEGFDGDLAVIWGTQPVVRTSTIERTILIHQAAMWSAMTFPTAVREKPYAPIIRDKDGWVVDSLETHLEGAEAPERGEDNVGFFVVRADRAFEALERLRGELFLPEEGRYWTESGELGFPNMVIRRLVSEGWMVLALPLADPREAKGIKVKGDAEEAERYIEGLGEES